MPDQKSNNEIDLLELLLKAINVLRTNFWLIVIFFVLGLCSGLYYFYTSKKIFESKMIISSGILTTSYTRALFDNANRYLGEGNVSLLASQFNISEAAANEINSLRIENVTKVEGSQVVESDKFILTAEVLDQRILPELQQGLINYLENNEYAKVRVEQNRTYIKQMLANLEKEITDMEEFKLRISNGEFFQSAKGNIMFDPTSVNSKILELKERRIVLTNSLQISNSVQVIDGFTKFDKHTKPKLSLAIAGGSFIGLFLVGCFIAFKSIRKLLTMAEAANQS